MNNKKLQVWLPLFFSITMIVGMFLGYRMRDTMPGKSFFFTDKQRPLQEILDLIRNKYVDEVKIDQLTDTAIQAMLSRLDPHSVFIAAEDLKLINDDLAGNFYGIGVEFNIFNDTLNVINVMPDGPGSKAGLMTGDKFLKIDDSIVAGKKMNFDDYIKLLRGDRDTKVTITFLKGGEQKKLVISRDAIAVTSVDAMYMLDNLTGYIRINRFSAQTHREFMEALEKLKTKGMQKMVLDLRGNGGGILEEAVEIADEFLDADKLITYTEGIHYAKKEYRCRRAGLFEKGKLIVLADEGTASASEILIGALQDWDRATIIGRRTFGKGLVQEQFDLSDRSALRLTIGRYYTPVGRCIQRPYTNGTKAYLDEISNRYHDGETQTADSIKNDKTKVFKTMGGKTVYGGGGITPDYFVAIDTAGYNTISAKLFAKATISRFVYNYYLQNQALLKGFKEPEDFIKRFVFTEDNWQSFSIEVLKDSIPVVNITAKEKNVVVNQIRASIGRQLWRNEGYFEVLNSSDDAIKKAKEQLLY